VAVSRFVTNVAFREEICFTVRGRGYYFVRTGGDVQEEGGQRRVGERLTQHTDL